MPAHLNVCMWTFASVFAFLQQAGCVSYDEVPLPTAVLAGHTATLHCSFRDLTPDDVVIWTGPGYKAISYDQRVDPKYPRYQVVGDKKKGEFHLQIQDAHLEDKGTYKCNMFGLPPKEAILSVVVPVPQPPTLRGFDVPAEAGQQLELRCSSLGGHPLPGLTWYNGTEAFAGRHIRLSESEEQVELVFILQRPTKWDNGMNLTCRATQPFPEITSVQESWAILRVHYPPSISVPSTSVRVKEGDPAALLCLVDSNPPARISWTRLGRPMLFNGNNGQRTFRIFSTSRNDEGVYQCTAGNGILPIAVGSVSLEVLYPPWIDPSMRKKVTAQQGEDVFSLDCLTDGNPKPRVKWRRKDTNLFWENPIRFNRVRYDVEGMYQCVATSEGFPVKTKDVFVDVVGKPYLEGEGVTAMTSAAPGETLRLDCTVTADPLPSEFEWIWTNNDGMERRLDSIVTTRRNQEMTSTLTIPDVSVEDGGNYVCKTANMFGSAKRNIYVDIKETMPKLILIASISAGAVLVVTVVVAVVIIAKKKGCICKPNRDESFATSASRPMPPVPKYVYQTGTIDSGVEDLELQEMIGTLKPRPPTRIDKGWESVGISYTGLAHSTSLPPYSTEEEQ